MIETKHSPQGSTREIADVIDAVRRVCADPAFAVEAAAADEENRTSLRNVEELRKTGLVRAVIPNVGGGLNMGAGEILRMMEIIAQYDSGAATVINMNTTSVNALSMMPQFPGLKAALDDALQNGAMFCGGASAPTDVLDAKKAGYRFEDKGDHYLVNGRGGFATGSETAKYFFMFGRDLDPDKAHAVVAVMPMDLDGFINKRNWNALGLRATGSHDVEVRNVRLPKDNVFSIPLADMARATAETPREVRHFRARPFAGIMGCQLGAAQRALNGLKTHLENRIGTIAVPLDGADDSNKEHSKTAWARHRLGRMAALLDNARVVVYNFADELELRGDEGNSTQYAYARSLVATKMMLEEFQTGITALAGAHGYVASSPLNLALRDLVGFNAMVWRLDELMEVCGRAVLGDAITVPGLGGT